jgi:hypothetical protein
VPARRARWWRGHRVQPTRGGTLADSPMVTSRRQGIAGELVRITGRAPGNESGGGAHRGWWSTTRWGGGSVWWHAAGSSPEGARRRL